ncbi:hypothetical protein [Nocardioides panaciterrulae]|uniref:Putative membrane protein n=1 Tax=Nocardioides panaciterrulae TaxID=661492 RepID=A0A7Y9EAN3_9ACTN|nr:hypothetical protein [Nocardioides panaciterrulae]NYD43925.1 putative membrane protein [Nocardioides panaciterrulae]NYD43994.1 putative membrane protein [Nocardioides panaciterrulae]
MSEAIWVALIATIVSPLVLLLLNRAFGHRRDEVETEASVSAQWQAWSEEQGKRIEKLEARVTDLEQALIEERRTNASLQEQNRRQASMLTSLIRWAILLRDEVIRLGGDVPPAPIEVESALTTLDP